MTKRFESHHTNPENTIVTVLTCNRNNKNALSGLSAWLKRLFEKLDS